MISILGGGPAGLAVGHYAAKKQLPFKVYEANHETGGNCRTIESGGFKFDTGAHRLHGHDEEVVAEIRDILEGDLNEIHTPSYIFHNGRFLMFPLTPIGLIKGLSLKELVGSLWYLLVGRFNFSKDLTFQDTVYRKYGKGLSNHFLTNYSEKLWGLAAHRLSPNISGSRLKKLTITALIKEMLIPNSKSEHMEGSFYYPSQGFGQIASTMADRFKENILLGQRISRINHNNKRITSIETNNVKSHDCQHVISSLPITLLIKMMNPLPPDEILDLANSFHFRHLTLCCFFLDKKQVNSGATIYFPSSRYPFTRGYEPRNRSVHMSPRNKTSFIVEVPDSKVQNEVAKSKLIEQVCRLLIEDNFFRAEEIISTDTYQIPFAYPVLEYGFEEKLEVLYNYLDQFQNLKLTGRNGLFEYSWTHNMMRNGKAIIDEFTFGERLN